MTDKQTDTQVATEAEIEARADEAIEQAKAGSLPAANDLPAPPEAGASVNYYAYDQGGSKHQFTLRAASAGDWPTLLYELAAMKKALTGANWTLDGRPAPAATAAPPAPTTQAPAAPAAPAPTTQAPAEGERYGEPDSGGNWPGETFEIVIIKVEVKPNANDKAEVLLYAEGHNWADLRATMSVNKCVELFAQTGGWTYEHFMQAQTYQPVDYLVTAQYSPTGRKSSRGNYYKDIISIAPRPQLRQAGNRDL